MEERSHQPFLPFVVQLLVHLCHSVLAPSVLSLAGLFLFPVKTTNVCKSFREVKHVTHQNLVFFLVLATRSFPLIFVYLGVLFIFYAFVNIYMAYYLEIGLS